MDNQFIVLCKNDTNHVPQPYDPAIHGHDVKRYETREECQGACDRLNEECAA